MDTNGAQRFDVARIDDAGLECTVRIPRRSSGDFANLILLYNVPRGALAIYGGSNFTPVGGNFTAPFEIDWRLAHGSSNCIFDQNFVQGTTNVLTEKGLQREGLLFEVGGVLADAYLLQARVRPAVDSFSLQWTAQIRFTPGLQGAALAVTVGSMIG